MRNSHAMKMYKTVNSFENLDPQNFSTHKILSQVVRNHSAQECLLFSHSLEFFNDLYHRFLLSPKPAMKAMCLQVYVVVMIFITYISVVVVSLRQWRLCMVNVMRRLEPSTTHHSWSANWRKYVV